MEAAFNLIVRRLDRFQPWSSAGARRGGTYDERLVLLRTFHYLLRS